MTVPATQDYVHGPAMAELNDRQRAFVDAMIATGGAPGRHADCVRMAGYSDTGDGARAQAYRLLGNPKILAAIRERANKMLHSGALLGMAVIMEIASDETHKDRLKAASRLLDHAGLGIVTKHEITVDHTTSDKDMIARMKVMAAELGVDSRKLLGSLNVIDAEFEEVKPATAGSEGLEDLL